MTSAKKVIWWAYPLHQLLSTVGILILAGLLTFNALPSTRASWILTEIPFFPIQVVLAFYLGFLLRHYLRHEAMEWVWILPTVVLSVGLSDMDLSFSARLGHYFGWACRPELRCFDQLGITLPFYAAAAYSLAAFVSRHVMEGRATK